MTDTVQRTLEKMKATFGEKFKTYYDGDPEAIPAFDLPALIVTQSGADIEVGAMGQDDVTDRLTVKVVMDKRDDFSNDRVDPLNMTERKIRDLVARRDDSGDYHEQTVLHVVRELVDTGTTGITSATNVEYGINPRPSGEGYADLTAEGHVTFSYQYLSDTV